MKTYGLWALMGLLLLSLPGCKNCAVDKTLAAGLSFGVTAVGRCKKPDVVAAWANEVLGTDEACSALADDVKKRKGVIGALICPTLASTFVAVVGTKIPQKLVVDAECDPSFVLQGTQAVLSTACIALFPLAPPRG